METLFVMYKEFRYTIIYPTWLSKPILSDVTSKNNVENSITFFFLASCSNHCLAALDLGTGVELPVDFVMVQNRHAMQSMRRPVDWTLEDNTEPSPESFQ